MSDWFFKDANGENGPVSANALKKLALKGIIKPDTPVRKGTDGRWGRAKSVAGLTFDTNNAKITERDKAVTDVEAADSAEVASSRTNSILLPLCLIVGVIFVSFALIFILRRGGGSAADEVERLLATHGNFHVNLRRVDGGRYEGDFQGGILEVTDSKLSDGTRTISYGVRNKKSGGLYYGGGSTLSGSIVIKSNGESSSTVSEGGRTVVTERKAHGP